MARRIYLAESKPQGYGTKKGRNGKNNLTAYESHHMRIEDPPRERMAQALRQPI